MISNDVSGCCEKGEVYGGSRRWCIDSESSTVLSIGAAQELLSSFPHSGMNLTHPYALYVFFGTFLLVTWQ